MPWMFIFHLDYFLSCKDFIPRKLLPNTEKLFRYSVKMYWPYRKTFFFGYQYRKTFFFGIQYRKTFSVIYADTANRKTFSVIYADTANRKTFSVIYADTANRKRVYA